MLDNELLKNSSLRSDEKLVLAYCISLHKQNKFFWGKLDYLAKQFGTTEASLDKVVSNLISKKLLYKDKEGNLRLEGRIEDVYRYEKKAVKSLSADEVQEKLMEVSANFNGVTYGSD